MSIDLNNVVIAANLGADAEQRYTPNGQSIVTFRGATTRRYTVNGQKREDTSWLRYVMFGEMGEKLLPYLTKGKGVVVTGRIEQRSYQAKDGSNREAIEIHVGRIQLLGGNGSSESPKRQAPAPKQAAPQDDDMEYDDIPF